ncbi:MAG: EamA family transporter [Deltaproteobacteria bacterium]|nr:EamA family transporter [Deltaproteobacteria bacterium]
MPMNPIAVGTALAALAAFAFGVTTPFIQRLGAGLGPFATAALLYAGAALGTVARPRGVAGRREAAVRPQHLPRLLAIAFFGAALAPTLFAWGLQRVPATYGSLLLNGEAVFTVGLAALIYREHVGRRVALAVLLMFAGGVVTVAGASSTGSVGLLGALAVVAAVFAWALDNVLTRPFAELDPAAVVRVKALCGAVLTGTLALLLGEPHPSWAQLAGLLACGATGYGLSLRLYLLAQRRMGAGRTGSVFAVAPFVGALVAILMGDKSFGIVMLVAAVLFVAGLVLHLTEKHRHEHAHDALNHDHAHTHDDGHHDHRHETSPDEPHAHPHEHDAGVHAHPHGPDAHHGHRH